MAFIDKFIDVRGPDVVSARIGKLASSGTVNKILLIGGGAYAKRLLNIAMRIYQPAYAIQTFRPFVIEHVDTQYRTLRNVIGDYPGIVVLNYYAVDAPISDEDIRDFYVDNPEKTQILSLNDSLIAAREERNLTIQKSGIAKIKTDYSISVFDMVIVDGPWFTTNKVYEAISGALHVFLLDINSIKNADNVSDFEDNSEYERTAINKTTAADNEYNNGAGVAYYKVKT